MTSWCVPGSYLVFSNIPFNITSEILEFLFTAVHRPDRAYLILQTDTLIGKPYHGGAPTETFKSLMIKPAYTIQRLVAFSKNDFKPRPSVDTTLFGFARRDNPLIKHSQYDLYKNFLAFIAKDRVGEGAWRKIFSKRQLANPGKKAGLIDGKGLKSQSVEAIASLFTRFMTLDTSKRTLVSGAMARLRAEQQKMEQINQQHTHRRPKRWAGKFWAWRFGLFLPVVIYDRVTANANGYIAPLPFSIKRCPTIVNVQNESA